MNVSNWLFLIRDWHASVMDTINLYDSKICRLCAEDNPNGVSIYDKISQDIDLEKIINKYLPFKVSRLEMIMMKYTT